MRFFHSAGLLMVVVVILACNSGEADLPKGDATGFNPKAWFGKTRADIAQMHPEITRINEEMSSGPFKLSNAYGVKSVNFSFEDSWLDGVIRSVNLTWENGITIDEAAKKFGLDIAGKAPTKTPQYWEYPINTNRIKFFNVKLKPQDSEKSLIKKAWIVYANS